MNAHCLSIIIVLCNTARVFGYATAAATATSVVLKDFSGAASGLFNNMRTPAALVGGALVPLGILSAPKIEPNDSRRTKFFKKANILLAIASLLSEVIAITYSTIAINKIAELEVVKTQGVAQFIGEYHLLPWLGTNVHFLLGLFGFGLLTMSKPYFLYGKDVGNVAACWACAAMTFCISIVNKGISMGHYSVEDTGARFSSNFFFLLTKYFKLVWNYACRGKLALAAFGFLFISFVPLIKMVDTALNDNNP